MNQPAECITSLMDSSHHVCVIKCWTWTCRRLPGHAVSQTSDVCWIQQLFEHLWRRSSSAMTNKTRKWSCRLYSNVNSFWTNMWSSTETFLSTTQKHFHSLYKSVTQESQQRSTRRSDPMSCCTDSAFYDTAALKTVTSASIFIPTCFLMLTQTFLYFKSLS